MQDIREWFAPLCLGNFGKYTGRLLFEVMPILLFFLVCPADLKRGVPNGNIVQKHLNIGLLNVF